MLNSTWPQLDYHQSQSSRLNAVLSAGCIMGRLLIHHQPAAHSLLSMHLPGSYEQQAVCGLCPLHHPGYH